MGNMPHFDSDQLFIGIDGGGTKCRARIFTSGDVVLGTGIGGPANPLHGQAQAKASILQSVEMALTEAGLPNAYAGELIAGIGLAGVNLPSLFEAMSAWHHPFKKMYLTTDLHIACLGAHNRDEGAVIIAGTGSCGYSYVKNKATSIGGHGFPYGDKAGGAWFGLEALKSVLIASDNLGPHTLLTDLIGQHFQAKGVMIVDKMGAAKSSDYAKLARYVFEAANVNDEVAVGIVREGADYLSAVAEKLWETEPGRMSFIGGLSDILTPWLKPKIAAGLSQPIFQPEFGAAYFAKQQERVSATIAS